MKNITVRSVENLKPGGLSALRNMITNVDHTKETNGFRKLSHKLLNLKIGENGIDLSSKRENRKLLSEILKNSILITIEDKNFNFLLSVIKRNIDTLSFNIIKFKKEISAAMKKIDRINFDNNAHKTIQHIVSYIWNLVKLEYYKAVTIESDETGDTECDIDSRSSLFSGGSPNIQEIKQGNIGDCYLISTLIGLADKNPEAIKKCFVNRDTLHEDGFVKMRFYKVEITVKYKTNGKVFIANPRESVIIQFNKKVWNAGSKGPVWVKLFERGFAIYRKKLLAYTKSGDEDVQKILATDIRNELTAIEDFRAFIPLCAIEKRICKSNLISNYFESGITPDPNTALPSKEHTAKMPHYTPNHEKIFSKIKKKLDSGSVLVGFTKEFTERVKRYLTLHNIQSLHAYTIMSIDKAYEVQGFKLICIKNPNQIFQNVFKILRDDTDSNTHYYYKTYYGDKVEQPGMIVIDIKDFVRYFSTLEYDTTPGIKL